jgi:hypothetical protein
MYVGSQNDDRTHCSSDPWRHTHAHQHSHKRTPTHTHTSAPTHQRARCVRHESATQTQAKARKACGHARAYQQTRTHSQDVLVKQMGPKRTAHAILIVAHTLTHTHTARTRTTHTRTHANTHKHKHALMHKMWPSEKWPELKRQPKVKAIPDHV